MRSVFVVNVGFLTQTQPVPVMKKKKSTFHGLNTEVTVGTCTALSLVLVKSFKSQCSLAILCTLTEMRIDKVQQEETHPFCKARLGM